MKNVKTIRPEYKTRLGSGAVLSSIMPKEIRMVNGYTASMVRLEDSMLAGLGLDSFEEVSLEDLIRSMEIRGEPLTQLMEMNDPLNILLHLERKGYNVFHDDRNMISQQFPFHTVA